MVARRLNSAVKALWSRCQMRIRALSYPQPWHNPNLFFTPLPQPVHGCVPGPCLRRARWILQCSPKQLLPHCSMEPITNHLHVLVPFIVMLWYTHYAGISNRKYPHLFRLCFLYRKCPPSLQCLLPGLSSQYTIVEGVGRPLRGSWLFFRYILLGILWVYTWLSLVWGPARGVGRALPG